jgi:hypothetical protein
MTLVLRTYTLVNIDKIIFFFNLTTEEKERKKVKKDECLKKVLETLLMVLNT